MDAEGSVGGTSVVGMAHVVRLAFAPPSGDGHDAGAMGTADPRAAFKLRPRELFFTFVGLVGSAGAFVFWFRAIPETLAARGLTAADLSELGQFVTTKGFQFTALGLAFVLMAGGISTRTSLGKDRATWILAAAATVVVAALMMSLYGVGDPLLAPPPAGDDGP